MILEACICRINMQSLLLNMTAKLLKVFCEHVTFAHFYFALDKCVGCLKKDEIFSLMHWETFWLIGPSSLGSADKRRVDWFLP